MISAALRNLHIYRDHECFRQSARIALWKAWNRFDDSKGEFAPYAYRCIRGAMLDELKKQRRFEENVIQTDDDILHNIIDKEEFFTTELSETIETALVVLNKNERELLYWLFVEELTLAQCAERANITIAGIKKRRERTLNKLKKILSQGSREI